ncbi:nitrile hydratase subunit beta [Roseovarius pelagicus]|uniref:Nitrile hydratase subunit beta n=1 Tax=Roseovarius pelagicus TaxID=2980108 RepID=A0ABY6DCF7_9RHOB|nr:nitrile hydratase subunit beta [Roseovarius pelagicus]UXX83836.1 nitrile hydratase subunit beta [Roseovarius pelagicus]
MSYPPETADPKFAIGQRVRARDDCPAGHTRVPRYVRGHVGVIEAELGIFQFADAMARGDGPDPHHCYTVRFSAADLWGSGAERGATVFLDLWEPYLDPA